MRTRMKRTGAAIALAAASMAVVCQAALAEPPVPGVSGPSAAVENFTLSDQAGTPHELRSLIDASAIVIVAQVNADPVSRDAVQSLESVKSIFRTAEYFLLNSSSVDTRATIAAEAKALGSTIPILDDESQAVGRDLGFTQTGEAIIIDPAGSSIVVRQARWPRKNLTPAICCLMPWSTRLGTDRSRNPMSPCRAPGWISPHATKAGSGFPCHRTALLSRTAAGGPAAGSPRHASPAGRSRRPGSQDQFFDVVCGQPDVHGRR